MRTRWKRIGAALQDDRRNRLFNVNGLRLRFVLLRWWRSVRTGGSDSDSQAHGSARLGNSGDPTKAPRSRGALRIRTSRSKTRFATSSACRLDDDLTGSTRTPQRSGSQQEMSQAERIDELCSRGPSRIGRSTGRGRSLGAPASSAMSAPSASAFHFNHPSCLHLSRLTSIPRRRARSSAFSYSGRCPA